MSISELDHVQVADFGGPWPRLEASDVPIEQSLLALNCEYNPGQVGTRRGFKQVWNPNEPMNSMFDWVSSNGNYLIYYNATSGKVRLVDNLASPSPADLYTQAGAAGASITSNGTRVFIAHFDPSSAGVGQCRVVGKYGASINTDKAFLGPLTVKPTLVDTGTGSVTAGVKRVGYILQTRNGYVGKLSPTTSGGTFDITSTVTATGGKTITFAITTTWPTESAVLYPIMTTSDNLDRYFIVPGLSYATPGGTSWAISATIDISDADLASTGTDVTDNLQLLTQDVSGNGPFSPFHVGEFGLRTTYLTEITGISQAYVSDASAAQKITADRNVVYLPGFRQMKGQFSLGKVWYVLGPHWTYAFEDSSEFPVNWAEPRSVDGSIGVPAPRCVTVNASQGFAWVAHQTGLWLFSGGAYQTRPISYYYEPDWKRIKWSAAATIQVIDNKDKQQVYVLAPLDSATQPSHILMFDYSNGTDPDKVKPSTWNIVGYAPGCGCIVENPTTKLLELWLGNSAAGAVGRQMNSADTSQYADFTTGAIDWQFETALMPGLNLDLGRVYHHYATQTRVQGVGTFSGTAYGIDRTKSVAWPTGITLSALPGQVYTKRYPRLRSESVSYRFTMNAANSYCILSMVDHYYKPGPSFR